MKQSGVEVSGEALSFVEGEVKEGDVETVDGGREEVEKVIEAVGVLKGVEVKIVGGEVVVECEGVEKRVGWEGKSGIFLKNALRASMRGVRLEASMNGLEGKEGLEGVTFSLKGQSAVVVKYGEVEREVDVGKMGDRWVLQKMKLLVVGKEVRGEGREERIQIINQWKKGLNKYDRERYAKEFEKYFQQHINNKPDWNSYSENRKNLYKDQQKKGWEQKNLYSKAREWHERMIIDEWIESLSEAEFKKIDDVFSKAWDNYFNTNIQPYFKNLSPLGIMAFKVSYANIWWRKHYFLKAKKWKEQEKE